MSLEIISKNIERCYQHPNLSGWHVREALRQLLAEVRLATRVVPIAPADDEAKAEVERLRAEAEYRADEFNKVVKSSAAMRDSMTAYRDAAIAKAERAERLEQELRAEISAAFTKHGLAAGPRAVDALVEERDAAIARAEKAEMERNLYEAGAKEFIATSDKLTTARATLAELAAAMKDWDGPTESWRDDEIINDLREILRKLRGSNAIPEDT